MGQVNVAEARAATEALKKAYGKAEVGSVFVSEPTPLATAAKLIRAANAVILEHLDYRACLGLRDERRANLSELIDAAGHLEKALDAMDDAADAKEAERLLSDPSQRPVPFVPE